MSIAGLGPSDPALRALFGQRRADFKSMVNAVEAGDISAAQTALAAYQQDDQALQSNLAQSPATSGYSGSGKIQTDLSTLTAAIGSGNLKDAQSALAAYEQDRAEAGDPRSNFQHDLTQLIQDAAGGDAQAAQADAANLAADLEALFAPGKGDDHDGPAVGPPAAADAASDDDAAPTSSASTAGTQASDPAIATPAGDGAAPSSAASTAGTQASDPAIATPAGDGAAPTSSASTAGTQASDPAIATLVDDFATFIKDALAGNASALGEDAAKLAADFVQPQG